MAIIFFSIYLGEMNDDTTLCSTLSAVHTHNTLNQYHSCLTENHHVVRVNNFLFIDISLFEIG